MQKKKKLLVSVDAPDPDNLVLVYGAYKMYGTTHDIAVQLTGRPVRFGATKDTAIWDYSDEHSQMALKASAGRLQNFMSRMGVYGVEIYDGGVAPRTLVPHHIHFADYYRFLDHDPLASVFASPLRPIEDLVKKITAWRAEGSKFDILVGGPMTGVAKLLMRDPKIANDVTSLHAMMGSWGNVTLMDLGGAPRGAKQFNLACDPQGGDLVFRSLDALDVPIYFSPSEVTRVESIGFENAQALKSALGENNPNLNPIYQLYCFWYDAAVKPRGTTERIYIHDVVALLTYSGAAKIVYETVPVEISSLPIQAHEQDQWGVMGWTRVAKSNITAGVKVKDPNAYMNFVRKLFV